MRSAGERIGWIPPLLVGASAAVAAEVAMALLLYTGPGLARSLTTVLAVEGTALGVGLWTQPRGDHDLVERLRRRWLLCLAAFVAAAVYGTSWSVSSGVADGRLGQGIGLAVLAALPVYACGSVLAGMSALAATHPSGPRRGPGAAAAIGAGMGFVLTGALLPRAPIPASLLVACLVFLSGGGMVYGVVLASWPQVLVRASLGAGGLEVRVEDRKPEREDGGARYLLEGGHVRRRAPLAGDAGPDWSLQLARALLADGDEPRRVLAVGGGASAFPAALVAERPGVSVDVLERTAAVVELAREHFDAPAPADPGGRLCVEVGNLEDLLAGVPGTYDLVLVDTSALAPLGGIDGLSRAARAALLAAVDPARGTLAWGPEPPAPEQVGAAG
ncbi:MAG TPA: hypothetical protein VFQ22_02430, partial [Longimicrobiales bacterium]|nr:hypothetical protein [Longimicrobiales bacterium]